MLLIGGLAACGGRYTVRSYPTDAKLYIRDLNSNEKRLVGNTPSQIAENKELGDVFYVVLEKENFKSKEIMVKVAQGESLSISATLDPLAGDAAQSNLAQQDKKDSPQGSPKKDDEPKDWEKEIADMKLRIALLENTASFTRDALFSPRLAGGQPPQDRDRRESVVSLVFQAQQNILKGRHDEALATLDRAIQLDEFSTNAWTLKGSVKYLKKDYEGARVAWERTLKLDPHNKSVYKYLNNIYKILKVEALPEDPAALRYPASQIEIERRQRR